MRKSGLLALFLNEGFRNVAVSFVSFFSGIFIYKSVLPVVGSQRLALAVVIVFNLGLYIFKALGCSLSENLSQKHGLKWQIFVSQFLFLIFIIGIGFSFGRVVLLLVSSFFWGLSAGFYWFGRHSLMAKDSGGEYGKEIGLTGAISSILLAGVPFFGGLVISNYGYFGLFISSSLSIVISTLFLSGVKDDTIHHDTTLKEVCGLFLTHKKIFLTYFGYTVAGVIYADLFPLYLFLILGKELALGEFFTAAMLFGAILNIIVGKLVDLKGNRSFLRLGSITLSLAWVGRFLTKSISDLLILDVIERFTSCTIGIPLSVSSYQKAVDGHSTGRAILFQELAIGTGQIFASLLVLGLILAGAELRITFIFAALFSLAPLLII